MQNIMISSSSLCHSCVPLISTGGTNAFSLLQLEVEMKVLKSQECTAEQSTIITKEEVDMLR